MQTLQDREQALENKYAHDQEVAFRVTARRDKLLAQWVSGQVAATPAEEAALVTSAIQVADGPQHEQRILDWAISVLVLRHKQVDRADVLTALREAEATAKKQIAEG